MLNFVHKDARTSQIVHLGTRCGLKEEIGDLLRGSVVGNPDKFLNTSKARLEVSLVRLRVAEG